MDLLSWSPPDTHRKGGTYEAAFDYDRLNAQQRRVYTCMSSGCWLTLREISNVTGDPEASVSARIRDMRNMFHLKVERRRKGQGTFEYSLGAK